MNDRVRNSKRPYLIRAMHAWMMDNGETPHVVVDAEKPGVEVPRAYVKDGKVVLNLSSTATQRLVIGNDWIDFQQVRRAGILGNIGWECSGFKALQEVKPVMGGIGGLGWCQWTGRRRTSFVNWLRDHGGADWRDDEANYGYLLFELHGPESASLNAVKSTSTVEAATSKFMDIFEVPNKKYARLDSRIGLARLALQQYGKLSHA